MQSAMNYFKRRLSETNFTGNLPNGYFVDIEDNRRHSSTSNHFTDADPSPRTTPLATGPKATDATMQDLKPDPQSSSNAGSSGFGFFSALKSTNAIAKMRPKVDRLGEDNKIILVIDDEHTDWKKHLHGLKLYDTCTIRVEQASFQEITLTASTSHGVIVEIKGKQDGNSIIRSFKPHFVLVRQSPRSMAEGADFRNIIIGLKFGGIPSVNSLHSIYNFLDRPWTFAQLIRIQKRLGSEKFPLISQTFYPSGKEMLTASSYPVVVKIGHAHNGNGKLKVDSYHQFQDVSSIVTMSGTYAISEPFVDSKFDVRVQKIGGMYRAYVRTSISNSWKANTGSAVLEEIPVSDSHRLWVDACSEMFGGLDIVAVKAVHGADGKDYIIEVSDCTMPIVGEKQEEDKKMITSLVQYKMQNIYRPKRNTGTAAETAPIAKRTGQQKPATRAMSYSNSAPASPPDSPSATSIPSVPATTHYRNSAPPSPASPKEPLSGGAVSDDSGSAAKIRDIRKSFVSSFFNE